ncbi:hypothetical protein DXA68_14415 [Bacteroides stercorirosoris]|uniref:Carboxypeptidase regulatory-like domain-containing protein n=1 Tax=Bacteroides stercorirosoris TaxID=871324 RepID=A0A413H2Q0_9BACE|nr:hypothetical protein DXA68_14415 [Bacteroides stercorirosoris]
MRLIKAILFCLCMCSFDLYAQVNVTGIVNDNTGETLPGVSILAKDGDRTYGTTTQRAGSIYPTCPIYRSDRLDPIKIAFVNKFHFTVIYEHIAQRFIRQLHTIQIIS